MVLRDSLFVQAAGPAGLIDVEEARLGMGALVYPGSSLVKAKSGFRPGASSPGLVSATGTPDANVHVAPFQLLLQSGRASAPGVYIATADAIVDINVLSTPANATNPRNDLIIAQQSDTFYGDGTSPFEVKQIVGTPSGTPADPAVPGSADYVPLARVRVDALATTIVSGKITDLRTSGHAKSLTGGLYTTALGGILPVASQAERDALAGIYDGLSVWRQDLHRYEVYNGTSWQGVSPYLARQTLGASAGSVVFSGIPTTLRRLSLYWTARGDAAAVATIDVRLRVNGDTGALYLTQLIQGSGATASAVLNPGAVSSSQIGTTSAATATASLFGSGTCEFQGWDAPHAAYLGYTTRSQALAGAGFTTAGGGVYATNGPFTSITILPGSGNFIAGSDFQIEGF